MDIIYLIVLYLLVSLVCGMLFAKTFPNNSQIVGIYTIFWPVGLVSIILVAFASIMASLCNRVGKFFQYLVKD